MSRHFARRIKCISTRSQDRLIARFASCSAGLWSRLAMPPSLVLLAYWMGGVYLMGVKRYSECRSIIDRARAASI